MTKRSKLNSKGEETVRTSPSYIDSFNYHDPRDQDLIEQLRKFVKNKFGSNYRIKLQGRLGRDNSAAKKYRSLEARGYNAYQYICLCDSGYVDAYLYTREWDPRVDSVQLARKVKMIWDEIYGLSR